MSGESDEGYVPDAPSFGIFFLLKQGADPAKWVRLWSGDGDFPYPADAIDTTGGLYIGLGFPSGLPELTQCINGAFDNLEFVLSGVDENAIKLAGVNRHEVFGSSIHVGMVDLDEHQQPVGSFDWFLEARAGMPRIRRTGQGEDAVRAIVLPSSTAMIDRNTAEFGYWTPGDQRRRSPTDAMCDFTPKYGADTTVAWPAAQ